MKASSSLLATGGGRSQLRRQHQHHHQQQQRRAFSFWVPLFLILSLVLNLILIVATFLQLTDYVETTTTTTAAATNQQPKTSRDLTSKAGILAAAHSLLLDYQHKVPKNGGGEGKFAVVSKMLNRVTSVKRIQCPTAPIPKLDPTTFHPIWIPGYPGSGSELLRQIVGGLTGGMAGNYYSGKCVKRTRTGKPIVTCKTHWPLFGDDPETLVKQFHTNAFMLLRNPAYAIPSYYSWIWERDHRMRTHMKQAPERDWRLWRDDHFEKELNMWKDLIVKWLSGGSYTFTLIIPYEKLIDESVGLAMMETIGQKFTECNVTVIPASDQKCIWNKLVQVDGRQKRQEHSYQPGFRMEQKVKMLAVLEEIMNLLPHRTDLMQILNDYKRDIETVVRIDEGSSSFTESPQEQDAVLTVRT